MSRAGLLVALMAAELVGAGFPADAKEPTNPAAAVLKDHIMVTPGDIRWGPCSTAIPPGAQCATIEGDRDAPNVLFTYRLKMPDNYKVPPHFHPADEHLTVIAGTFNMGLGKEFNADKTTAMVAGCFMVMPKGEPHFAWTRGETILQVHAIGPWGLTYVNPADDPRRRP
jgi:quercetin dioxygenase-like cupin family protein